VELTGDASALFPTAPGIYAVYDKAGDLQYVGLSRRVSASLQSHLRDLPEFCASAKVCGAAVSFIMFIGFVLGIFSGARVFLSLASLLVLWNTKLSSRSMFLNHYWGLSCSWRIGQLK
jgi:hypothetical protein